MGALPISLTTSDYKAVTSTSTQFDTTMVSGVQYMVVSSVAAWIRIGSNPTAAADTDQNHYLPANVARFVAASGANNKVAIIRDTADGDATLSAVEGVF